VVELSSIDGRHTNERIVVDADARNMLKVKQLAKLVVSPRSEQIFSEGGVHVHMTCMCVCTYMIQRLII
jgi:hypothetical protein